jgi:hypothetical protein
MLSETFGALKRGSEFKLRGLSVGGSSGSERMLPLNAPNITIVLRVVDGQQALKRDHRIECRIPSLPLRVPYQSHLRKNSAMELTT